MPDFSGKKVPIPPNLCTASKLYDNPLLNSFVKISIIFTIFGCNELIHPLLQKIVHFLNLLFYLVLKTPLHAADIIACASDEIDVVNETGSRLIGPTFEDSDGVDVTLWSQGV